MKIMRVWFVALVVVALLRNEPFYSVVNDVAEESGSPCVEETEIVYPQMPEPQEWFSFLDQETGTWRK